MGDPVLGEKHVLGAAQADTLGAKRARLLRVAGNVSVGSHSQFAEGLRPTHELHQFGIIGLCIETIELALDHTAGGSVERNPVALLEYLTLHPHLASLFVYLYVPRPRDTTFPHAARDYRRMTGHPAARGQNARCDFHAVNIFRSSFRSDQDDWISLAAMSRLLHCLIRREHNLPNGCARRRRKTGR